MKFFGPMAEEPMALQPSWDVLQMFLLGETYVMKDNI